MVVFVTLQAKKKGKSKAAVAVEDDEVMERRMEATRVACAPPLPTRAAALSTSTYELFYMLVVGAG